MGMLDALLTIKLLRENRAETTVRRQRLVVAGAHRDADSARTTLTEYQAYAQRREALVYRELCTRVVQLRDLEEVQQVVAGLRAGEAERAGQLAAATATVATESAQLEQDLTVQREAARVKEKFLELVRRQADIDLLESGRREDLELEEVAALGQRRAGVAGGIGDSGDVDDIGAAGDGGEEYP